MRRPRGFVYPVEAEDLGKPDSPSTAHCCSGEDHVFSLVPTEQKPTLSMSQRDEILAIGLRVGFVSAKALAEERSDAYSHLIRLNVVPCSAVEGIRKMHIIGSQASSQSQHGILQTHGRSHVWRQQ